ncbi:unnamed protein product, partial [Amoebophrya sp. A25]
PVAASPTKAQKALSSRNAGDTKSKAQENPSKHYSQNRGTRSTNSSPSAPANKRQCDHRGEQAVDDDADGESKGAVETRERLVVLPKTSGTGWISVEDEDVETNGSTFDVDDQAS